jgi:hypothetical protein
MKIMSLSLAICGIALLVLTVGAEAMAGPWNDSPTYFSGVINDYSPASVMPAGPWEVRGPWSLKVKKDCDKADFSAALTMELSDYTRTPSNVDSTSGTTSRMQHTHHITIEDGMVTQISTGGFQVTGPVTITKDGSPAPLAASTLTVEITGGTTVEFSNITLQFDGGATVHFGSGMLHGVVRKTKD